MNKDKYTAKLNQKINDMLAMGGSQNDHYYRRGIEWARDLAQSEPEETCIILPCKTGETVYTIGENNSPCEKCSHGKEVNYDVSNCLLTHIDYVCPSPEYYIESHVVEGFEISSGGIELVEEWGYDCKHIFEPYYLTREAAEATLKEREGIGL